jgi:thiamine-phosphate pyrophosphorylase
MPRFDPALYVVTDRGLSRGRENAEVVRRALAGGATMIQYREKSLPDDAMAEEAAHLLVLCRAAGVPLVINDRIDVALRVGADGLHVGQGDLDPGEARRRLGDGRILGVSVHDAGEARRAEALGADYIAANGLFPTASKTDLGAPLGLDGLARIAAATSLPVVAIGGIHAGNAASVVRAGAAGIAVISAVVSADDIEGACAVLRQAVVAGMAGRG